MRAVGADSSVVGLCEDWIVAVALCGLGLVYGARGDDWLNISARPGYNFVILRDGS